MRVAVVGANGFVGRELSAAFVEAKYDVIALSRRAPEIAGATGLSVDVADGDALQHALAGCEVAFYLVHSLSVEDFRARDRQLAEGFGRVGAAVGVRRIVYLGGLGHDPSSEHLASRQEVGIALASGGVPVVELRAAVVLGAGSISFEMLRYLTERLPFMVCPRWVRTGIQPIASADIIRYLIAAIDVDPGVYEVGGADVTSYREMISAYALARRLRPRRIIDVPYLTPRLSSYWLDLVTPVDRRVSHALIESLGTEVVVHDQGRTDAAFGIEPMGLGDALLAACGSLPRWRRAHRLASTLTLGRSEGTTAGTGCRLPGKCVRCSVASLGKTGRSATHERSSRAPRSTGGSSLDVTPDFWCCALFTGFLEKHGSAMTARTTN
jgi:uncharacterized protein YbjT (DUF2867 family)